MSAGRANRGEVGFGTPARSFNVQPETFNCAAWRASWCPGWESNPQGLLRKILSLLRLPIPPPGRGAWAESTSRRGGVHEKLFPPLLNAFGRAVFLPALLVVHFGWFIVCRSSRQGRRDLSPGALSVFAPGETDLKQGGEPRNTPNPKKPVAHGTHGTTRKKTGEGVNTGGRTPAGNGVRAEAAEERRARRSRWLGLRVNWIGRRAGGTRRKGEPRSPRNTRKSRGRRRTKAVEPTEHTEDTETEEAGGGRPNVAGEGKSGESGSGRPGNHETHETHERSEKTSDQGGGPRNTRKTRNRRYP